MLGLMASSAMASTGHGSAGSFGTPSSNDPGGFNGGGGAGPVGLAIRQSTGDVFVSDPGHTDSGGAPAPRVEQFDAAGAFVSEFAVDPALYSSPGALAVDQATGDVYVAVSDLLTGNGAVLKYSAAGAFIAAIDTTGSGTGIPNGAALAVDPVDGTVYVGAFDDTTFVPVVAAFDSAGAFVISFDGSAGGAPDGAFQNIGGLAVDGSHRVYVSDLNTGHVNRYDTTGAWQVAVDDASRGGSGVVTADGATDEVYAVESGAFGPWVAWFSAGGADRLENFGAFTIGNGTGVGVNETTGTVYVTDGANSVVQMFTTFAGPTVTTDSDASIDPNNQTLNGTVNPEGLQTSAHFEWGADTYYGAATGDIDVGAGSADVPVTDTASGLSPNTLYHYRLVGVGPNGPIAGNDRTFTTAPAPPTLDGVPAFATPIDAEGAKVHATVNPNGSDTTYHFDYGTTTGYGSSTTPGGPESGQGDREVTADLTGLQPGTTYHFRLVADNGTGGVQNGADATFRTAPATPAGASSVTGVTAALTGVVNPNGSASTYRFEYGLDTTYGSQTNVKTAGSGSSDVPATTDITGLTPNTLYHVRVVLTNTATGAVTNGVDGTFTTNPAPTGSTGAVTNVTTDHASFSGTYDTNGLGGTYRFLVSSSTSTYAGSTEPQSVSDAGAASGTLTDLLPGEAYTVRLAVTSSGVTTLGDAVTFSTAPMPPVAPAPPANVGSANPYGCAAPVLAAYNKHPKPGDTITIAGTDLGVGGSVVLGDATVSTSSWSASGFSIVLPDDAKGTLPLTINCGKASNTIAIAMYQAPSNSFTAKTKTKGSTATLKIKVPGAGSISVRGGHVKTATRHAGKAATYTVKVTLTSKAKKSLKRHKKLRVSLAVRFTPNGGSTATKTVKVTFKR